MTAPLDCSGWPEARLYMEAQQWFTSPNEDINTQSQHTHIGACVPYNQTVSGTLVLDVLVQLHLLDNRMLPSVNAQLVAMDRTTGETKYPGGTTGPINLDCSRELITCKAVYRMRVDTTVVPRDGVVELRLSGDPRELDPAAQTNRSKGEDFRFNTALGVDIRLANGRPAGQAVLTPIMGRGTMSDPWSYTEAFLASAPYTPVSGIWTPRMRSVQHGALLSVTRTFVSIDPSFHANPFTTANLGMVVLDVPNAFNGALSIDTRRLTNGWHRLFMRTEALAQPFSIPGSSKFPPDNPFPGGDNSGILLVAFQVQN